MKIRPLGKRVLVEKAKPETEKKGILLLNAESKKNEGIVVAIGEDVTQVKVGDEVIYPLYIGTTFEDLVIMSENDILCILHEE